MSESAAEFVWPVRVYYEDTDAGGVVYYANYLRFMERARTEWLRALGLEQSELLAGDAVLFVVRRAEVDYRKPARYDDALEIRSRMELRPPLRILFHQRVECNGLLVEGKIEVVCVNAQTFRPVMLPQRVQRLIERLEQ